MSSDSEFYPEHEYENISRNIIAEVKKRPALYDHTTIEYNNKHDRKQLWQDVYRSIFKDWDNFTEKQQKIEGEMIQKKWKNIKDSFLKELAYQKGKTRKKKRKYIHYDSLLFLLPTMQRRSGKVPSSKLAVPTNSGSAAQPANDDSILPDRSCSRDSTEQKLDKEEDIDEEKHFAMMLVAMLRKLDDDQKHYAKVEILNVLHKARSYTSPWPVAEDVRIGPHSQLSLVYGNASDPLSSEPACTTTTITDVDKGRRKTRVKEEIDIEETMEDD